ncbi:MAG: hypothetical protein KatS3mg126_2495 [Lysobacteraceae bacterium]|nr:MAG: hypothetical protein KatS3mg126_2495 [Xanthomonadaceae bacterium]
MADPSTRWPTVALAALLAALSLLATARAAAPDPERSTGAALSSSSELDPWEGFNRPMYRFNRGLDKLIFRPVARVYDRVTPSLVKQGVGHFFDNLLEPVVSVNLLLQGRPRHALQSLARFLMNTTLGLGGVLDPATHARLPSHRADFGQTLGRWGWQRSRYVMLPIFGPATLRDGLGKAVNARVSPIDWLSREHGPEYSILYGVSARARALPAETLLEEAADEYVLVRDVYLQNRRCQIVDCSEELPDYLLPDYEFEVPDFEALQDEFRR